MIKILERYLPLLKDISLAFSFSFIVINFFKNNKVYKEIKVN